MPDAVADPKVEPIVPRGTIPAADAAPVADPRPAPTAEEIAAQSKEFRSAFFDNPRAKTGWKPLEAKPEPVVEEPKVEPAPPAPEPKADVVPPVVPPKPEPVVDPKQAELDEQARIDAAVAARLAAAGIDPNRRTDAPPVQPEPEFRVGPGQEQTFKVLAELEKSDPRRYANVRKRTQDFWQAETAYRRKWAAEHAGEQFDTNAEEHAAFYAQNEPSIDQTDFNKAERKLEREQIKSEVRDEIRQEFEPELKAGRIDRAMKQVEPVAREVADKTESSILADVPEAAKAKEANPKIGKMVDDVLKRASIITAEITKMDRLGADYARNDRKEEKLPSGESFRPHVDIGNTLNQLEHEQLSKPAEAQMVRGKQFITLSERAQVIAQIRAMPVSEAEKTARIQHLGNSTFTMTLNDITERIKNDSKRKLKELADLIPATPSKPAPTAAPKNGANGNNGHQPKPPANNGRNGESDTVSSGDVLPSRIPQEKSGEKISSLMWRR